LNLAKEFFRPFGVLSSAINAIAFFGVFIVGFFFVFYRHAP
jgi:hypothetical protein